MLCARPDPEEYPMNAAHEDEEEAASPGVSADLIKSYLAFALRAVRKRRLLAGSIFGTLTVFTILAVIYWPRTYHCDTVLMIQGNQMFQDTRQDAMSGAAQVITRHENLEALVRQTNLVKDWDKGRTAPYRLKDKLMTSLRGPISDKDKERILVGTLQYALGVNTGNGTLTISIDWGDPEVAARIVGAAQQSFLQSRHSAEVSTLGEYISILEGHALKVHDEIDAFAGQIQKIRSERLAEVEKDLATATAAPPAVGKPPGPRRPAPAARSVPALPNDELISLKERLEEKQRELKELQEQRTRRLAELQARMLDLRTKFTGAHPEILSLQRNIDLLSTITPPEQQLQAEVASLKTQLQTANSSLATLPKGPGLGGGFDGGSDGGATTAEPLGADIIKLMQDTDESVDPAVAAQLRFAVEKYAMLRGKINAAKVDLDTAQAAFKHRYQVVVPAEPPNRAIKPKVPVVLGGGLFAALLLALIVCLLLELRTGILVERWQIYQIGIPVLGELRLPPHSD